MKYILPYLAEISFIGASIACQQETSDELEDNSTIPPQYAMYVDEGMGATPYIDFLNPLNISLPVLNVIKPIGFRLTFETDVPEEIFKIECKSNINHYTDEHGEYVLYIHGNFTKCNSQWTYTNTDYMLNASDSIYTVIKWSSVTGHEYFESHDYDVNETDIENAIRI